MSSMGLEDSSKPTKDERMTSKYKCWRTTFWRNDHITLDEEILLNLNGEKFAVFLYLIVHNAYNNNNNNNK